MPNHKPGSPNNQHQIRAVRPAAREGEPRGALDACPKAPCTDALVMNVGQAFQPAIPWHISHVMAPPGKWQAGKPAPREAAPKAFLRHQEAVREWRRAVSLLCRSGFQPRRVYRGWKPLLQESRKSSILGQPPSGRRPWRLPRRGLPRGSHWPR
jgi:hypothetical protein